MNVYSDYLRQWLLDLFSYLYFFIPFQNFKNNEYKHIHNQKKKLLKRLSSTIYKVRESQDLTVRKELQPPLISSLISHRHSIPPALDFSHIKRLTISQVPRPFHDPHDFPHAVLSSLMLLPSGELLPIPQNPIQNSFFL